MSKQAVVLLGAILFSWGLISCQKLSDVRPTEREQFPELSPFQGAIPADYGDLIGVTTRSDQPLWTQAWFMKPDKSIVVVLVNLTQGTIADGVVTIPRK